MSLSVPKLSPFGEEFGIVEQTLRLQLGAPSLIVNEMYDISLKPINVQFDSFVKNSPNSNIVDVFIPVTELKQTKNDVISHGIKVHPKDGFTFKTSGVNLDLSQASFELVHLQVALGMVINHTDTKTELNVNRFLTTPPTVSNLPEGYQSIRISEDFRYVVFNHSQVRALHLVRFVWKEGESNTNPSYKICDNCKQADATVHCQNCNAKFCSTCDGKIHNSNKFLQSHVRTPFAEAILKIQKCPEHPQCNVDYYCVKCHLPVCYECKVKGSHSRGEAAKHKLIPISQAYNEALTTLRRPNPVFVSRENALRDSLQAASDRLVEIETNEKAVEDEIMRIAYKAIEESRNLSSRNALKVKSTQLELQRKLQEFEKQKSLLENYRQNAEPVPFLQTLFRNSCLERSIDRNQDLPTPIEVRGDLIVYGRLEVGPPKAPPKDQPPVIAERGIVPDSYDTYTGNTFPSLALEPKEPHITRLEKMALRKKAKYEASNIVLTFQPFANSEILTDTNVATKLYMCFPFKATPETHLIFSTSQHGRNIRTMHKMIDNMGITAVIVKSGDQIFGGFAASKWNSDGIPKTEKSSTFLFQINRDAFIPYGGRSDEPCYMFATPDTLTFGREDLCLAGNFDNCSSNLESSFGVGFAYGSKSAKEFLAGQPQFVADSVEIWGFFTSE